MTGTVLGLVRRSRISKKKPFMTIISKYKISEFGAGVGFLVGIVLSISLDKKHLPSDPVSPNSENIAMRLCIPFWTSIIGLFLPVFIVGLPVYYGGHFAKKYFQNKTTHMQKQD